MLQCRFSLPLIVPSISPLSIISPSTHWLIHLPTPSQPIHSAAKPNISG